MRYQIFPKAFETTTLLDGAVVVEIDGVKKTRYKHFCSKKPNFLSCLRQWGEAGMVKVHKKTTPKVDDRGITCMMVGYTLDHKADCYSMLHPTTSTIYDTHDVIWLKRMYYLKPLDTYEDDDFLPPWPEHQDPTAGMAAPAPPNDADAIDDLPTPQDKDEAFNINKDE
eukprot:1988625-Ditylum_brightwellii.AAC.1